MPRAARMRSFAAEINAWSQYLQQAISLQIRISNARTYLRTHYLNLAPFLLLPNKSAFPFGLLPPRRKGCP